ncbi:MAG: hypothetical protein M0Z77_07140 [Thermoplasmatales archaeon]|nr:hypothetical protein [Thermoplasmatales archaeon]
MRKSIVGVAVTLIVIVLVASLIFLVEGSEQPHINFVTMQTAEEISGQNYTLTTLSTTTGSSLPYAYYGEKLVKGVLYSNGTQSIENGSLSYYYFQDYVLEFNTTAMAQIFYQTDSGFLSHGNGGQMYPTGNYTFKGFSYIYTTVPQKRYGSQYFWGTYGYSGNLVFEITGQSPSPPNTNMANAAIDQIDAMTAFFF